MEIGHRRFWSFVPRKRKASDSVSIIGTLATVLMACGLIEGTNIGVDVISTSTHLAAQKATRDSWRDHDENSE
jgi:hypothetical protein